MTAGRIRTLAAVLVVLGLLGSACGTQVSPDIRRRAWAAAAGGEQPGLGGAPGAPGTGTASGTGGAGAGAVGGHSGSDGAGGGSASDAGDSGGGAAGGDAGEGGNGGATDVGVTADSITLGNVSDLSGPRPGLFQGAVAGTQAYFAFVNSRGGVDGRLLKLAVADGKTDCAANQNQHQQLAKKVLAFVGSFSLYDNCGIQAVEERKNLASVAYALSPAAKDSDRNFPPQAAPPGYQTGMFAYWKRKYGDATANVGTLHANIPSAAYSHRMIKAAAESVGWRFVYDRAVGVTETDFTADVVRMRNAGVQLVFLVAGDVAIAARFKRAADQQDWHPTFVMPLAYDSSFVEQVGGARAAEGVAGYNLYSLFFSPDDARNIRAVRQYQSWMKRTNPDVRMDVFSMYGWSSAALFVQALEDAGPRVTREKLLAALNDVHEFDAGGVVAPTDPAGNDASSCYVLWRIHNGGFQRVDTPPADYRCDGGFYRYRDD